MALSTSEQRAVLAARDVLAQGGRITVSSRSFWARHDFPPTNIRRDIVQTARELLRVSEQIQAGGITGTLAQALSDAGLPTTDQSGGLTGGNEVNVFARVQFGGQGETPEYRIIRMALPWDTSLSQLDEALAEAIDTMAESYGYGEGVLVSGGLSVY